MGGRESVGGKTRYRISAKRWLTAGGAAKPVGKAARSQVNQRQSALAGLARLAYLYATSYAISRHIYADGFDAVDDVAEAVPAGLEGLDVARLVGGAGG